MALPEEGSGGVCQCLLDGPRGTCLVQLPLAVVAVQGCSLLQPCWGGAGPAPQRPRPQSLLAELKQEGRALCLAQLPTCWVATGKSRPLSVPQLSKVSFGAQDMGLSPVQRSWDLVDECLSRFLRWRILQESKRRSPNGAQGKEI